MSDRFNSSARHMAKRTADLAEMMEMLRRLGSPDGIVRHLARNALVSLGEQAVGPLMLKLTLGCEQERWEAAKALGQIGTPSVARALVCALEDPLFGVRWLAAEGLIGLGRKGLPALLWALVRDPESWWLREGAHHVLYALTRMGVREPIEPVLRALNQSIPPAHEAMEALRELGEVAHHNQHA